MFRPYPIKTPNIFRSIFNKWIWSFDTNQKDIYLTFDDGPIPEVTPWVLEQLKKYNAKATFFCIGDNIRKHPNIYHQIITNKHSIGNHTFNHIKGWNTDTKSYINNTLKCESYLNKNTTKLFRPPYGKITPKQANQLNNIGYRIIMWDVLSGDFDKKLSAENCTSNVLKNVKSGSIVVFHDSIKAFPRLKETLPIVLKTLSQKGYKFKAIY